MASDSENLVQPTQVRLYHRFDPRQNQFPKWKTPTNGDFTQKVLLVKTNSMRYEIQVWDGPNMDSGSVSDRGSPRSGPGMDPGSQLALTVNVKTMRSCVFKGNTWIEITDSSGQRLALEFIKDDPNFLDFDQKLRTLVKLLEVKCKTKETFNRAKWFPPPPRQLPPVPTKSNTSKKPSTPMQSPSSASEGIYDYFVDRRENRANSPENWPKRPPPPPPSKSSEQRGRQVPSGVDRRRPTDSFDTESISNSTNSMVSGNGSTLDPNSVPGDDGLYLLPIGRGMPYANDLPEKNLPRSPPKVKPGPQTKGTSGSSNSTSGSDWSCSACTLWNSSTYSQCNMCGVPRKFDAGQCMECSKEYDFQRKGTASCQECRKAAVSRSNSLDCSECRKMVYNYKSVDCEECHRAGTRAPSECKACRIVINSRSLGSKDCKKPDHSRSEECSRCKTIPTKAASKEPTTTNIVHCAITVTSSAALLPAFASPASVNVDQWRCKKCTCLNPANVFYCTACGVVRDDAWQCQVCDAVISLDLVRCQRCDVWKCRLCTYQNDARQNWSTFCQGCEQPQ